MLNILIIIISSVITSSLWIWYYQYRIQRKFGTISLLAGLRKEIDMMIAEINKATDRSITLIEDQVRKAREETRQLREPPSQPKASSELSIAPETPSREPPAPATPAPENRNASTISMGTSSPETSLTPPEKAVMLYRNGHSISSIASELKMSQGEIKLMISLNSRKY